jgi:hypothetical protein
MRSTPLRKELVRWLVHCAAPASVEVGMNTDDIALQRLRNQQIAQPARRHLSDVVAWLGAVQAQDYFRRAVGRGSADTGRGSAHCRAGAGRAQIVRTWPTRGTIHCHFCYPVA